MKFGGRYFSRRQISLLTPYLDMFVLQRTNNAPKHFTLIQATADVYGHNCSYLSLESRALRRRSINNSPVQYSTGKRDILSKLESA